MRLRVRMTGTDFGVAAVTARATPAAPASPVLPGIDVLARDGFAPLKGKRVGLVTNHTGRAADGASTIDVIHQGAGVQLVALFSPEHGIRGMLDDDVPSSRDEQTGLPIHSLYGETRRPTDAMLEGLDALVIDLQDIGARFYTYTATMGYVLEEAAQAQDRGRRARPAESHQRLADRGSGRGRASEAFIAYLPAMPVRHGMTLGELARLFNGEKKIGAALTVVPAANWRRDRLVRPDRADLDQSVAEHAQPEPGDAVSGHRRASNTRTSRSAGAPISRSSRLARPGSTAGALAAALNARGSAGDPLLPGDVHAHRPASTPGPACQGVFMVVTNRTALQPVRVGLEIAAALWKLHGTSVRRWRTPTACSGRARRWSACRPARIRRGHRGPPPKPWRQLRAKYLLAPAPAAP